MTLYYRHLSLVKVILCLRVKETMKNVIIIGASSGIGRELAKIFSKKGYILGLTGRRLDLLISLQKELSTQSFVKRIDVSQASEAMNLLNELLKEMSGTDLIIINAGIGFINPDLNWKEEKETIEINISGFTAMANVAVEHFSKKSSGHIVGISSIAALRGNGKAPAYNASKAFMSNYLEGLRQKFGKLGSPIAVTDTQPGFVNTEMAKGEGKFWVSSPEKAAKQIYEAIRKKKKHAYITKRWRIIAWILKALPDLFYYKL
jgi:short-subunit dehydrogenase